MMSIEVYWGNTGEHSECDHKHGVCIVPVCTKTKTVFEWPCDKRKAHGPHVAYQQPEDRCYPYDCPGVKAHPKTMIGGRLL